MLNVICLKAGKAYGPEYVNILFDMVRRSLTDGQANSIASPMTLADSLKASRLSLCLQT